jgi:ankyrin repeat protein
MNQSSHSQDSSNTAATVRDLATDIDKCTAWLATRDGHTNIAKIRNIFIQAISTGRTDVCQLILDSGRLDNAAIAQINGNMLEFACYRGHLSVVQLLVSRCHPSKQQLYTALTTACAYGHIEIVTWLLNEMKLSRVERVRRMLTTASARGDINTVKLLAVQVGVTSTEVMSQALRVACHHGRVKVVDWLMTYTTAEVSLCGELDTETGIMTSLTAACHEGQANIVLTLLQCVTPHTVNIQCGRYNDSALHFAIFGFSNTNWNHSLHNACHEANIDDVSIAMYDTDVDIIDQDGDTPLHWACQGDNLNIVQMLLSVFARVDITNSKKRTPIEEAKFFGNSEFVPYMSQLLDVTNYTPSSRNGANSSSSSSVTRPTVDVIVSDVSIVASDVRSTQLGSQHDATNHRPQQQRQSNYKSSLKIV